MALFRLCAMPSRSRQGFTVVPMRQQAAGVDRKAAKHLVPGGKNAAAVLSPSGWHDGPDILGRQPPHGWEGDLQGSIYGPANRLRNLRSAGLCATRTSATCSWSGRSRACPSINHRTGGAKAAPACPSSARRSACAASARCADRSAGCQKPGRRKRRPASSGKAMGPACRSSA